MEPIRLQDETVWLSQSQMAELFQTTKQNVSQHIQNVFSEKELREASVVKDFFTTAADGKNYQVRHYNLNVIISVGYRVKSLAGTQFRSDVHLDGPRAAQNAGQHSYALLGESVGCGAAEPSASRYHTLRYQRAGLLTGDSSADRFDVG